MMARGRDHSAYQQGIIRRYYEHRDDLAVTKLGEIVSELFLADAPRKIDALWRRAEKALAAANVDPRRAGPILAKRDLDALATVVRDAFSAPPTPAAKRRSPK